MFGPLVVGFRGAARPPVRRRAYLDLRSPGRLRLGFIVFCFRLQVRGLRGDGGTCSDEQRSQQEEGPDDSDEKQVDHCGSSADRRTKTAGRAALWELVLENV